MHSMSSMKRFQVRGWGYGLWPGLGFLAGVWAVARYSGFVLTSGPSLLCGGDPVLPFEDPLDEPA